MATNSRSTRRLRAIKAGYRRRRPQPCMRCGQTIDYDAPSDGSNPSAFSLGHIANWHDHPELREDPANLRQEHLGCNTSAGKDDGSSTGVGMTSGLL